MAGLAAVQGMGFKYVAIFDADFEPCTDFVYQTVYHMEQDPQLGFVQVGLRDWGLDFPKFLGSWFRISQRISLVHVVWYMTK